LHLNAVAGLCHHDSVELQSLQSVMLLISHADIVCSCCCWCPQNKVVFDRMRSTALDMLTPGYDPRSGFGFVAGNTLLVSGDYNIFT
jgi:hypothetical protein